MRVSYGIASVVLVILLLALFLTGACGDNGETPETTVIPSPQSVVTAEPSPEPTEEPKNDVVSDPNQPPKNMFVADSSWPMNHGNPYCQGSSPLPGLAQPPIDTEEDFLL